MTAVINCSPVRVLQCGSFVLVQLVNKAGATALKEAFGEARLAQEDPAEFHRRYAEANDISEAAIQPE